MTEARRDWKILLLSALCAALVVWVAYGSERISGLVYAGGQAAPGRTEARPITIDRAPRRVIKDQYPSFSAVAINAEENMLVVADENLFQILEYDRRDNTPPQARFTEPKRVISGTNTHAEMICGVYIDPVTKEVYVLNNDTQNWLPVFSRDARGNATPSRYLAAPHGIALDMKNKLMFVSNFGNAQVKPPGSGGGRRAAGSYGRFDLPSITVYPLEASGNTKPLWIIEGSETMLNWPSHIALHEERQELFVANDADDSILVFRASDKADVAPIRMIKGPNTGIKNPPGITLDVKNGEISVASMGTHAVLFFPVTANGDVKPSRIIRGGPANQVALNIGNPGAVGYDTKRDQILVPN